MVNDSKRTGPEVIALGGSEMIHSWWRIKILRLFNGVDCLIQAKPLSSMKLKPKQHRCEPIIE